MTYVKTRVYNILTDKQAKVSWKLQELNQLLYSSETFLKENQAAVEALEQHIKDNPESDEQEVWKTMLKANQHDAQLHQEYIDYILEAIHSIKGATTGQQMDLFD